jgi:AraC family L-rhamnose operon transcriptional activator RhaR
VYVTARTLTGELAALRSDPLIAALVSGKIAEVDGGAVRRRPGHGQAVDGQILIRAAGQAALAGPESIEPHLAALAALPAGTPGDGLMRLGNLLAVLAYVVPALLARSPDPRPHSPHPAVIAATDLLHADPGLAWTLPELARRVHLSAAYLCRCFVRDLGLSPLRYLERYRLELVAQLLLDSDMTITEISARVGIADPNYLARRFRAAHGFTPSRYRAAFAAAVASHRPRG